MLDGFYSVIVRKCQIYFLNEVKTLLCSPIHYSLIITRVIIPLFTLNVLCNTKPYCLVATYRRYVSQESAASLFCHEYRCTLFLRNVRTHLPGRPSTDFYSMHNLLLWITEVHCHYQDAFYAMGHAVTHLVDALLYKTEGRGFDLLT